jgi:hypothetical protein
MAMGGSAGTYMGVSVVSMLSSGALAAWLKCLMSKKDYEEYVEPIIVKLIALEERLKVDETFD